MDDSGQYNLCTKTCATSSISRQDTTNYHLFYIGSCFGKLTYIMSLVQFACLAQPAACTHPKVSKPNLFISYYLTDMCCAYFPTKATP
jgi:hypothetical protein